MINVTRTFLPAYKDFETKIKPLWESKWLTNRGAYALELEEALKTRWQLNHLLLVNNGMSALQIAIKALGLSGEIITTPFSYVATSAAIEWEGCKTVFADIDPQNYCLDPNNIEALITEKTTAIIATHVFGNACDIKAIDAIAQKHNLKVIYDAAHAFDIDYQGKSIFSFGDISICSFHATKLFHTVEGGAIISNNPSLEQKIKVLHQFGHDYDDYQDIGMNAKISDLHAAMGLCLLPHMEHIKTERKRCYDQYSKILKNKACNFDRTKNEAYNFAYFPVLFDSESKMHATMKQLKASNIHPRRYFYPSLNSLSFYGNEACPISEDIASRILCLPFYPELSNEDINQISTIINNA